MNTSKKLFIFALSSIGLLVGCQKQQEPQVEYSNSLIGVYSNTSTEYNSTAKVNLKNTITLTLSRIDGKTLKGVLSSSFEYYNPTKKSVELGSSTSTLTKVVATDTNNFSVNETTDYFTSNSTQPTKYTYKGSGTLSNTNNLSLSIVASTASESTTLVLLMKKQ